MQLSSVQDHAIAARMALVRCHTFDRLFTGVRFDEFDGDLLYVSPRTRRLRPTWRNVLRFIFRSLRRTFRSGKSGGTVGCHMRPLFDHDRPFIVKVPIAERPIRPERFNALQ
jgi:hypothetical protein